MSFYFRFQKDFFFKFLFRYKWIVFLPFFSLKIHSLETLTFVFNQDRFLTNYLYTILLFFTLGYHGTTYSVLNGVRPLCSSNSIELKIIFLKPVNMRGLHIIDLKNLYFRKKRYLIFVTFYKRLNHNWHLI